MACKPGGSKGGGKGGKPADDVATPKGMENMPPSMVAKAKAKKAGRKTK